MKALAGHIQFGRPDGQFLLPAGLHLEVQVKNEASAGSLGMERKPADRGLERPVVGADAMRVQRVAVAFIPLDNGLFHGAAVEHLADATCSRSGRLLRTQVRSAHHLPVLVHSRQLGGGVPHAGWRRVDDYLA